MGQTSRRIALEPRFEADDFLPEENGADKLTSTILRRLQPSSGKLSRGAHARAAARPALESEVRQEQIASRADQSGDQPRRNTGHTRIKTIDVDFFSAMLHELAHPASANRRTQKAAEFFGLFTSTDLSAVTLKARNDFLEQAGHSDLRRLFVSYVQCGAYHRCPPGDLLRTVFKNGNPNVVLQPRTAFQLLSIVTSTRLPHASHENVFEALPDCALAVLARIKDHESRTGIAAPAAWIRPSDIGRTFLQTFIPEAVTQFRPSTRHAGVTPLIMPSQNRPDLEPLARQALENLMRVIARMGTRTDRRRAWRLRPQSLSHIPAAWAAADSAVSSPERGQPDTASLRARPIKPRNGS